MREAIARFIHRIARWISPDFQDYWDDEFSEIFAMHIYDDGQLQAGIRDDVRKAELKEKYAAMHARTRRAWFARNVRAYCLNDHAIDSGYGLEDVHSFAQWLDDEMGLLL